MSILIFGVALVLYRRKFFDNIHGRMFNINLNNDNIVISGYLSKSWNI